MDKKSMTLGAGVPLGKVDSSISKVSLYVSRVCIEKIRTAFPVRHEACKAYWLLDTIYRQSIYLRGDAARHEFVPLSFNIIQFYIGTRFACRIIERMKILNLIERSETYYAGEKCMGYRLCCSAMREIVRVEINYPSLARRIAQRRNRERKANSYIADNFSRLSFHRDVSKELVRIPSDSYAWMLFTDVSEQRYYLKRDKRTGRLFTPLVNLPNREYHLRSYLLFDGQPTTEIDVASAQPSLFVGLYPKDSKERIQYIEGLRNDALYQMAMRELQVSRNEAKKEFLRQCAYGPIQAKYPLFEVFCREWPEMGKILSGIRHRLGPSRFALEMQKREADIMIGQVVKDCAVAKLTALPIHDALLCKASEAEQAASIMLARWSAALGFAPRINQKRGVEAPAIAA